jgi:hypothetical protein
MFKLVTIFMLGAAQASAVAAVEVTNLPSLFAATCLDGQAKLSAGDVTRVPFDALPAALRDQLAGPQSGDVYRLNTSGSSYLYVLNYAPRAGTSPRICGLASDEMSIDAASSLLETRLTGGDSRLNAKAKQWIRPEDGYVAVTTKAGKYSVAQVSWMSDEDKAAMLAQTKLVQGN